MTLTDCSGKNRLGKRVGLPYTDFSDPTLATTRAGGPNKAEKSRFRRSVAKVGLTETFTGIEQFAGTCYEAAGVGSRAASPRAHPRTPRRFPLPLLPPRPELPRSLQPASQNRPPRVRRRTHRMTGRRPRHPAARTRHRWQIRAQPRTDSLSERTRERRARRHRRPGLRDEDTKKEGELTASRRLHATTPLHGAIVTGDAINCERKSTMLVVENGADFVFHLRDNQPTAPEHAMAVAARLPALPAKQSICATVG